MRAFALCVCLCMATPAGAQVDGHVSVLVDVLPDVSAEEGRQGVYELRTRLFFERRQDVGSHIRLNLAGHVDALLADRSATGAAATARDAIIRPTDLYADFIWDRFDLRVGASRLVWGRLDEFQPTDVVNPIDLTRFLLEGRSEARLAVALVRARAFLPGSSTLEVVVVPAFRRGRFDQLDEESSPFELTPPIEKEEPGFAAGNLQGGARFTSTVGRVDWGVSAFRGFRSFPRVQTIVGRALPGSPGEPGGFAPQVALVATYPRYTMLGADFETVRGAWGIRGEVATFEEAGRFWEGGVGVDRRAGDYRVASNVMISREAGDTDISLVGAADRSFARETRTLRLFAVYAPTEQTAFLRGIAAISVWPDVWLEGSAGVFMGTSLELLGQLEHRDFLYARLKVFF